MKYELKVNTFDRESSDEILYGEVTLTEDENYHILENKLIESGIDAEDVDVDEWFNENAEDDCEYSAREFYNSTIGRDDIEVTVNGNYVAELGDDTFYAHVEGTWDELYRNDDAIALAKYNEKLGKKYMDKYFDKNTDENFKEKFESVVSWEYEKDFGWKPEELRKADPEKLDEFDRMEYDNFQDNMEALIDDNHINWTTELKEEN